MLAPDEVERLRGETPGCSEVIHFNHAGASLAPRPVLDSVVEHLRLEAMRGGYEAATLASEKVTRTRAAAAELFNALPTEIALPPSDTAGFAKALWGLAGTGWFDHGGRVLVDRTAYNSHYLGLLQLAGRFGTKIEVLAANADGSIDLPDLDRRLDSHVLLVSATFVGTHRGLINPVAEIGRRTRRLGVLFVREKWAERMNPPGIDAESADWIDGDRYDLKAGAARFDEFETSYAARIGLGVAIDYALDIGIDRIEAHLCALAEALRASLAALPGVRVVDGGDRRSAIITFTINGVAPEVVRTEMARTASTCRFRPFRGRA